MFDATRGDGPAEFEYAFDGGSWIWFVEAVPSFLREAFEVVAVPVDQLDEDGVLRVEMVVETAGQDA